MRGGARRNFVPLELKFLVHMVAIGSGSSVLEALRN